MSRSSFLEADRDKGYSSSNEEPKKKGKLRKLKSSRSLKDLKKSQDENPSGDSSLNSSASGMRVSPQARKLPSLKALNISFKSGGKSDSRKSSDVPPVPAIPAHLPIAERFSRSQSPFEPVTAPQTPLTPSKLSPEVWNDDKLWNSRRTVFRSGSTPPSSASSSSSHSPVTPSDLDIGPFSPAKIVITPADDGGLAISGYRQSLPLQGSDPDERGLQRMLQPASFLSMSSTVYSDPPKKKKKGTIRRFLVPLTGNGLPNFGFGSDKKSSVPPEVTAPSKATSNRPISYMVVDTQDAQFAPMSWIEVDPRTLSVPEVFEDESAPVPSSAFIVPSPGFESLQFKQDSPIPPEVAEYRSTYSSHFNSPQRGRQAAFPQRPVQHGNIPDLAKTKLMNLRDVSRYRSCISKYYPAPPIEEEYSDAEQHDEHSLYSDDDGPNARYTIISTAVSGEGWKTIMDESMSQLTRAEFLLAVGKMIEEDKKLARMI